MLGEAKLHNFGILSEESDYRVHICIVVGLAYLFPTKSGKDAVESGNYQRVPAKQPGVDGITAVGYLVPPTFVDLPGLAEIEIPEDLLTKTRQYLSQFSGPAWTRAKGRIAERIGQEMQKRGMFAPFLLDSPVSLEDQLRGIDARGPTLQFKCDYTGGPEYLGGSGNLYLQTKERNPLGLH